IAAKLRSRRALLGYGEVFFAASSALMRSMCSLSSRTRAWRALRRARYSSRVDFFGFISFLILALEDSKDLIRVGDDVAQRAHHHDHLSAINPLLLIHAITVPRRAVPRKRPQRTRRQRPRYDRRAVAATIRPEILADVERLSLEEQRALQEERLPAPIEHVRSRSSCYGELPP